MKFYFAPLEGINGYIYRNAQADYFPKADKYFSPFLSPGLKKRLTPKDLRDVSPENNKGINLVPQIMAKDAIVFVETAKELEALGYKEVNLNLGCPSKTVVTKGRGAGLLADPEKLDRLLSDIFEGLVGTGINISLKTRIGMSDPEEFVRILGIYDRYPAGELIIHPRLQEDYYGNHPNMEMFSYALEHTSLPVVYNGDIFTAELYRKFHHEYPQVDAVMMGRGVLVNPALFGEVRDESGEYCLEKDILKAFHDRILADYSQVLYGEKVILFKMKELMTYMVHSFENSEKYAKRIRKAQTVADYTAAVDRLFAECELK
ncbi:MAG: tRNA-dihydrouridine synthase [Clostridiales bacterium]|nr:tRNA-dihydrouridine synthase [Clostridiales bacterium]